MWLGYKSAGWHTAYGGFLICESHPRGYGTNAIRHPTCI
jgi:hypothetical protein